MATATVLRGLVPVGWGLVAGLAGPLLAGGTLEGLLFEVASADLMTFATAPSVLLLVALLSLVLPAVRANRIDPARTLKEE